LKVWGSGFSRSDFRLALRGTTDDRVYTRLADSLAWSPRSRLQRTALAELADVLEVDVNEVIRSAKLTSVWTALHSSTDPLEVGREAQRLTGTYILNDSTGSPRYESLRPGTQLVPLSVIGTTAGALLDPTAEFTLTLDPVERMAVKGSTSSNPTVAAILKRADEEGHGQLVRAWMDGGRWSDIASRADAGSAGAAQKRLRRFISRTASVFGSRGASE